jgi:tetratricopeptide (TPR) repeat protein
MMMLASRPGETNDHGEQTMPAKSRKEMLEEMLREDPEDAFVRYGLAMEYVGAGENESAWRCFQEMFALTPEYVPAYLQAGQLLVRMGRPEEAREVFQHGIAVARQQRDEHAAGEMEAFLQQLE